MTEFDLTYKIIILEILSKSDFSLTNSQITDFFIENEITDYFTVQDALAALTDTKNIDVESSANQTFYRINEKGCDTLSLFPDRITEKIKASIVAYFASHALSMKEENSLIGDFFPNGEAFSCHLKKTDGDATLLEVSFRVPDQAMAQTICANWKVRADDVYDSLMDILVS